MEKTNCYNRTVGQEVLNKYKNEEERPSLKNLIKELVRGIISIVLLFFCLGFLLLLTFYITEKSLFLFFRP